MSKAIRMISVLDKLLNTDFILTCSFYWKTEFCFLSLVSSAEIKWLESCFVFIFLIAELIISAFFLDCQHGGPDPISCPGKKMPQQVASRAKQGTQSVVWRPSVYLTLLFWAAACLQGSLTGPVMCLLVIRSDTDETDASFYYLLTRTNISISVWIHSFRWKGGWPEGEERGPPFSSPGWRLTGVPLLCGLAGSSVCPQQDSSAPAEGHREDAGWPPTTGPDHMLHVMAGATDIPGCPGASLISLLWGSYVQGKRLRSCWCSEPKYFVSATLEVLQRDQYSTIWLRLLCLLKMPVSHFSLGPPLRNNFGIDPRSARLSLVLSNNLFWEFPWSPFTTSTPRGQDDFVLIFSPLIIVKTTPPAPHPPLNNQYFNHADSVLTRSMTQQNWLSWKYKYSNSNRTEGTQSCFKFI